MSQVVYLGKRFKSEKHLDSFKKNHMPKIIGAINREYHKGNCARKDITRDEWRRFCLVHYTKQNLGLLPKAKIGYLRLYSR